MTVPIAFLRAINVGDRTVKMDHLRGLFEALGMPTTLRNVTVRKLAAR